MGDLDDILGYDAYLGDSSLMDSIPDVASDSSSDTVECPWSPPIDVETLDDEPMRVPMPAEEGDSRDGDDDDDEDDEDDDEDDIANNAFMADHFKAASPKKLPAAKKKSHSSKKKSFPRKPPKKKTGRKTLYDKFDKACISRVKLPLKKATFEYFSKLNNWNEWNKTPTGHSSSGSSAGKKTRNAILAQRSRERRRIYVKALEASCDMLVSRNKVLDRKIEEVRSTVSSLFLHNKLSYSAAQTFNTLLPMAESGVVHDTA